MKRLLLLILTAVTMGSAASTAEVSAEKLQDQIRGGLLGQVLGDLNGLKHEMKYIAEPGNVERYVPALPDGAWTDDDTDVEWVYLVEMQQSGILLLPPGRIAELWKRHINRRIWCSHLYLRQLLDLGIEPPLTGSVHLNPWAEFNLSGQFVSESWGLISPGMPQTAARIGTHYVHVSVDGEPIQAAQMFTSIIATAFLTDDIDQILNAGVAALDPASAMKRVIADVRQWHRQDPEDWRVTRRLLKERYALYGGTDVRDRNGVKLNGGATIAALLYGKGDFVETLRLAFNFGWDADNNAAMAGTVVGVIKGWKWLMSRGWDIKDVFRNTSRDDLPQDETLTSFGNRLVLLAERNIADHGGAKVTINGRTLYRIATEPPATIEPLPDPRRQLTALETKLRPEIEAGIARGSSAQEMARAAYFAICLDQAAALGKKYPERWSSSIRALSGYPKLLQVIFQKNAPPGVEMVRDKAVAAGLVKPAK